MTMLSTFKSLPVVREVFRVEALPAAARGYARDTITLRWEERLRVRSRRRSDGGIEFGTALERGTVLSAGDCFIVDPPGVAIVVVERSEPVCVVEPQTPGEWALCGYHIGNGHQPVMITEAAIICPDLPGVAELLDYHGIAFTRAIRPFTPVGSDVAGHRHRL